MTPGELRRKLSTEAEASGYHLNPDEDFTNALAEGLLVNTDRYGYPSCPCRLASGERTADLDIICPCDYRDADLEEYGACYCALYVSADIAAGASPASPVPERRGTVAGVAARGDASRKRSTSHPVWRCRVCGYLCARDQPPGTCPICRATRDRFEIFDMG